MDIIENEGIETMFSSCIVGGKRLQTKKGDELIKHYQSRQQATSKVE
ncbi:MAG: hypothetical protein OS130_11730 [Thermodesulfobacteriota bacterium]|jgi:hypothetical protein|nr:MAG: hypothetical protein OS130_11730 [Thermodesulfobacteriota bacterium]